MFDISAKDTLDNFLCELKKNKSLVCSFYIRNIKTFIFLTQNSSLIRKNVM